jgi:hypothetical protein
MADSSKSGWFGLSARLRWALAWSLAGVAVIIGFVCAVVVHRDARRADGHPGHIFIDFGGQYLMGRMVVAGQADRLYRRDDEQKVLQQAYSPNCGPPGDRPDDDILFNWLIDVPGTDIRGPLYPPIQAFLFAPLALLPPQAAYRVLQAVILGLIFFNGWLIQRLTGGRVWLPLAAVILMASPGCVGAFILAQNTIFSLTAVLAGWLLLARGRPVWAGVAWGLLAFKPVWALAFFLVPLLTLRGRMALAMLLTGAAQVLLTLPLVGVQTWLNWLKLGSVAAHGYITATNWIHLSRDLSNLPLRWLTPYGQEADHPNAALAVQLGTALWLSVTAVTILVTLVRVLYERHRFGRRAALDGPAAAFLLLGAYFSCFHFIFYDSLLATVPITLLFTDPGRYARLPRGWGALPGWLWHQAPLLLLIFSMLGTYIMNLIWLNGHGPPFDTYVMLALWAWCGVEWLRRSEPPWRVLGEQPAAATGAPLSPEVEEKGGSDQT